MRVVYLLVSLSLLLLLIVTKWIDREHLLLPTEWVFASDSPSRQLRTRMVHSFKLTSNLSLSDKIQNLKEALEYVNRLNVTNCENGTADTLDLRLDPTIWNTYVNVAVKTANFLSKYLQLNSVNGSLPSDCSDSRQQSESKRGIQTWLQLQQQFNLGEQKNTNISETSVNRSRPHSIGDVNIHRLLYLLVQNNINTDSPVIFGSAVAFEPYVIACLEKYSPYAHKIQKNGVYIEDLASKYNYLDSSVQWYSPVKAKMVQRRIKTKRIKYGQMDSDYRPVNYTYAEVSLDDGHWTNLYFDCGGGNAWMVTFSAPILWIGVNNTISFRGVATIDIHLTNIDINQCDGENDDGINAHDEVINIGNIFRGTHSCQPTTKCVHVPKHGFRRGSYRCVCKDGYYFPSKQIKSRYFNGSEIENYYASKQHNRTSRLDNFRCLPCARLCETCTDSTPCMYQENDLVRLAILSLSSLSLIIVMMFATVVCYIRQHLVIKSASPIFLLTMCLGAAIMSFEIFILYLEPTNFLCQLALWPKHLGFVIMYGSLVLKTWRISVIFKVGKLKRVNLPDKILLQRLMPMIVIMIASLTACTVKSSSRAMLLMASNSLKYIKCSTNICNYIFYATECLMLLYGVYLCFTIRKVPAFFNESRYITWSTYNALIFGSFLNIFTQFVKTSVGPDVTYVLKFLSIQISSTVTIALIFIPKFYALYKMKIGRITNTEAIHTVTGRVLRNNILEIELQDKSSQTNDNQVDKQCQCTLIREEESHNPDINSSCRIIWSTEEKERKPSVTSLKQFHSWRPQKKNKIASVSLKEMVTAESSNASEIL